MMEPHPISLREAGAEVAPTPGVVSVVRDRVRDLLMSSPSFRSLSKEDRRQLAHNLVKVASYGAELMRDQFVQAGRIGQTPVLVKEDGLATAQAEKKAPTPAEEFAPRAVDQAGRVTKETLNAINFPTFVADLIKGTFHAIVDASIQQMEAYVKLLENVAKTVDQFMVENITDNQARDYLAQGFPENFQIEVDREEGPKLKVRDTERESPDFKSILNLNENVSLDDESAEGVLVPAARRQLAANRHQMLSTMVLMGVNRIVVTSGKIRATMGFHLEARDTATAERATNFDFKNETEFGAGGGIGALFGGPNFKSRTSVAYVSTTKRNSTDEISMETDLTAEVDLKFKSDYFPLERFAQTGVIAQIQQNTANPTANVPAAQGQATARGE